MIPDLPPLDIEQALVDAVVEQCDAEQVDVDWLGISAETLPDSTDHILWQGDPCRPRPTLRLVALADEVPVARFNVRPSLTVWVRMPVAAVDLAPGDSVQVASGLVDLSRIVGDRAPDGMARVSIAAGEPLTTAVVGPTLHARSGDAVELVVSRGPLRISASGRLLEDARRGDRVRVANAATREVLRGVLVDRHTVEIAR